MLKVLLFKTINLGIDYVTLREELLNGMRLNRPFLSTPKVSHILQTCWLAEPDARPSFANIKRLLLEDDKFPRNLVKKNHGYYQVPKEKIVMHSQYRSIQKCHPLFPKENNNNKFQRQLSSVGGISEISVYPESDIFSRREEKISTSTCNSNYRGYLPLKRFVPKENDVPRKPLSSTTSAYLKHNSVATTSDYLQSCAEIDYNADDIQQFPSNKDDVFEK